MDLLRQLEELSDEEYGVSSNQIRNFDKPQQAEAAKRAYGGGSQNRCDRNQMPQSIEVRSGDELSRSYEASEDQHQDFSTMTTNSSNITHYGTDQKKNDLIATTVLTDKERSIFRFNHFNKMQSLSFDSIYNQNTNCIISSPTGSGKTVLFELSILRLVTVLGNLVNNVKILYVAPTKALCIERQKDWNLKFSTFGITVGALTSDTSFTETDQVKRANIIITTPEKWDLMTRKWTDYTKLFSMIKLLLIDEIHFLRENRGSTLEVVVTRMKKICSEIRIIALSATVPNIHDVSGWIKLTSHSQFNAVALVFGEEYRPVKLTKVIYGFKQTTNDFVFDSVLNSKLIDILHQHSASKPVLIFCPTRNSTITTAKYIASHFKCLLDSNNSLIPVNQKELLEISCHGVSFHHAGLSLEDRVAVEQNFIDGGIKILCSTSTLAVGVNLPAYLVIIKGTKIWNTTQFAEYSELDVLQMMGRAGRPQFETEGKAVLMTTVEKQKLYENLVKGNEKLESKLHMNLYENFVSEIYLKTITSLEDSLYWLKNTFFYARFKSNTTAYSEIPDYQYASIDERLMRYSESKIRELIDFNLISVINGSYQSTPFGDSMTRHYISFKSMKSIIQARNSLPLSDIIILISKAEEYTTIRLKRNEKRLLKIINESPILRFPLKSGSKKPKSIDFSWEKIYLLVQYELGGLEFPPGDDLAKVQQAFKQDKFFVFKHLGRIIRCLIDCFVEKKDYISLKNCLNLCKSVSGRGWEGTPMVLRQLSSIGLAYVRKFTNHNIATFDQIKKLESMQIEYYLGLRPGQGIKIKSQIELLPTFKISSKFVKASKSKDEIAPVSAKVQIDLIVTSKGSKWNGTSLTVCVISGLSTGEFIDFRRAPISKINSTKTLIFDVPLSSKESLFECHISCEEIAGIGDRATLLIHEHLSKALLCLLKPKSAEGRQYQEYQHVLNELTILTHILSEDEFEEDDDLDDLLVQVSEKSPRKRTIDKIEFQANNFLKCKHLCKDKTKCRHLCCREGLAPKQSKRGKNNEQTLESTDSKRNKQLNFSGKNLLDRLHTKTDLSKPSDDSQVLKKQVRKGLSGFKFYPVSNEPYQLQRETLVIDSDDQHECDSFDPLDMLNKATRRGSRGQILSKLEQNQNKNTKAQNDVCDSSAANSEILQVYDRIEQVNQEYQMEKEEEMIQAEVQNTTVPISFDRIDMNIQDKEKYIEDLLGSDLVFGSDVEVV